MITNLILLLVGIAAAIVASILFSNNKIVKITLQVVFLVLIVILVIMNYSTINDSIQFKRERKIRNEAVISKLKDIRTIQVAYKDRYSKYTGSFDTLLTFAKTDSFEIEKMNVIGDWNTDELTKTQAIKKGIIKIEKTYRPVADSLFKDDYDIDGLRYIPYTHKKEFTMAAGELETISKVKVDVFEAYAMFDDFLGELKPKQDVINYIEERYDITNFRGLKVGSLTEATNNAGNWEN